MNLNLIDYALELIEKSCNDSFTCSYQKNCESFSRAFLLSIRCRRRIIYDVYSSKRCLKATDVIRTLIETSSLKRKNACTAG